MKAADAYGLLAPVYDNAFLSPFHRAEEDFMVSMARRAGALDGRVLDLCCGTGWLGEHFPPHQYLGVDASEQMAFQAARRLGVRHRVQVGDAHQLLRVVHRQSLDSAVVMFGSWSYLTRPAQVAANLMAVLVPGGRFFITGYGAHYPTRPSYILRNGFVGGGPDVHLHSQPSGLSMDFHGFKRVRAYGVVSRSVDRAARNWQRWPARMALEVDAHLPHDAREWYYWCVEGERP